MAIFKFSIILLPRNTSKFVLTKCFIERKFGLNENNVIQEAGKLGQNGITRGQADSTGMTPNLKLKN
jgi:hypothetical protein